MKRERGPCGWPHEWAGRRSVNGRGRIGKCFVKQMALERPRETVPCQTQDSQNLSLLIAERGNITRPFFRVRKKKQMSCAYCRRAAVHSSCTVPWAGGRRLVREGGYFIALSPWDVDGLRARPLSQIEGAYVAHKCSDTHISLCLLSSDLHSTLSELPLPPNWLRATRNCYIHRKTGELIW